LQKYPDAKRFKRKGLAHYDKLKDIFAGKSATGGLAMGPAEVAAIGKAATSAREKAPCVSAAGSAPDAEEGGDSSDEAREVEKQTAKKSTARKRKSSSSSKSRWEEAIESQNETERYTSQQLLSFMEEKEARRASSQADSITSDNELLKLCGAKVTSFRDSLTLRQYSGFMMDLVNKKDLRVLFMSLPDDVVLPFVQGINYD
jgi:hypothetical protein